MPKSKSTIDEHGQVRDRRGEWRSGRPVYLDPLFDRPYKIVEMIKWVFGFPGLLFPWFAIFMVMIMISYFFFTPELSAMSTFQWEWMLSIAVRNTVILFVWYGAFHLWLIKHQKQGRKFKYNANWMAKKNSTFLFNDQVYDNVFWSFVGALFWSAYECGMWWAYSNNLLPFSDIASGPVYFCAVMLLIPIWRNIHFYFIHRLIHWKPLYDYVHYLHHKNVNVGPWSGIAMHPIEHLIFFSSVLIHLVVPSHPLHMMFTLFQSGLGPGLSHSGFDELVFGDEKALRNDRYYHYLHHRYHNVNYGESNVPIDKWVGSFHDGSEEATERFRKKHIERTRDHKLAK
jgi:sterol desaturase/sphingolipid hydroxylase (fatty acid hydroxylase superfamily)|tara:strand:- start:3817 stop:4842 length:1026 start_codon:yes stop_codon:yes gene_type:complete